MRLVFQKIARFFPVVVAAFMVLGCTPVDDEKNVNTATYKKYSLSLPQTVSFFETSTQGAISLYAGYGYERSTFYVFAFDEEKSELIDQKQYELSGIKSVCEGQNGVLLSGAKNSQILRFQSGKFTLQSSTTVSCLNSSSAPACGDSRVLFNGLLPGRLDHLSICYDSSTRQTSFHITAADGTHRDLGIARTSHGGEGRFVVTRGRRPDTFLIRHTRNTVREGTVLVDVSSGTLSQFDTPDLSDTRQSRGFGAGTFGVVLHPAGSGIVAEGEGGDVFFLKEGRTQRLAKNAIAQSVRIGKKSCLVMLVARTDAGADFRIYDLCD